jgi:thiamine biosynthesis lipoprotein
MLVARRPAKLAAVPAPPYTLQASGGAWRGDFVAMASPCTVLVDGGSRAQALALVQLAYTEVQRIEHKFSRYRAGSVLALLHAARGASVTVDDETAALLDFAAHCHAMSGGLFDITSGVLRAAWRFDGGSHLPDAQTVRDLVARVGWARVQWQRARLRLRLPEGMELDLGGIGKEYAADRVLGLLMARSTRPLLVNLGGDLVVSGARADGSAWTVGIESLAANLPQPAMDSSTASDAAALLSLRAGALATSGDARRFVLNGGVRYGHILDPRSGWPVRGAPRSVTVAAPTCTEAGLLSTLAMLQGAGAEAWLAAQGVPHWVLR